MSRPIQQWRVLIQRRPERVLRRLPKDLLQRIRVAIRALAEDPRPPGCGRLSGYEGLWRIRVGDWRITYVVDNDARVVVVLEISPRGNAYRRL